MARLSKTTPFQIYSDNGHSTPEGTQRLESDEAVEEQERSEKPFAWSGGRKDDGFVTESDDERKATNDDRAQEGDDEKNYTRTSISSFPESSYPTDYERTPMHKPYTPTYARPSSRRMQMSSPLRKGKSGTPYSEPRGSPRSRRKDFDVDNDNHETKRLPLILLHITTLPVKISWTYQAMRDTLPQHVLDNLRLLKSKLSDTVLKRGILIPHPRDDYELLEEKLLEALELQEPRISKCGHYRNRHSTDSTLTESSNTDSGVGFGGDGSDEEHCTTCHHHLRAAGSGKQKWSIKIYAANGLMRASAWSAAWSEMERVDVEIMPWITDELRIKLDEMDTQELVVKEVDHESDELRINRLVEERIRIMEEDTERAREAEMSREIEKIVIDEQRQFSQAAQEELGEYIEAAKPAKHMPADQPISTELPNIYRPKDIPLSILLWNYIFLLARKPRNMAMFFLVLLVSGILLTVEPATMSAGMSDISTLIVSKADNIGFAEYVPKLMRHDDTILTISELPSQAETTVEVISEVVMEAHDNDTVTVSDSTLVPEDNSLAWTKKHDPEEMHANIEQLDHDYPAEPETLVKQMVDDEDMVGEATRPQTPDIVVSHDPPSAFEEIDRSIVEGVQTELDDDMATLEQNEDVQLETDIPSAPDDVETEVDSTLMSEYNDSFVASISPQSEVLDKCLPRSVLSGSPAVCDLDSEEYDSFDASSSSQVELVSKCLPYSILSRDPAICDADEQASAVTDAGTVME